MSANNINKINARTAKRRGLAISEVQRILSVEQAKQADKQRSEAVRWPGPYNLILLAEAVERRLRFVTFEDGKRFTIKYVPNQKVYIQPDSKDYVPCGYFSFDRLKEALVNNE